MSISYKKAFLTLLLPLTLLSSCINVTVNSARLSDTDQGEKKVFILAKTIDTDETYLTNIVSKLKDELDRKGWLLETYTYQVKSSKDDPLEIEKRTSSYSPGFILEVFVSDQLVQTEYTLATDFSQPRGTDGHFKTNTSANIAIKLEDYLSGTEVWQSVLTVTSPSGLFGRKLKSGNSVKLAVAEIIKALQKDGILHNFPSQN